MASTTDIIVVGAGIVGCAVAYELASRGASVEVVDDRPAGMGATQASAGVLAPYIEGREASQLLEFGARSLEMFDTFVARVSADARMDVGYRRTGTLDVALSEDGMLHLEKAARALSVRGVPAELFDARTVRLEEPHISADAIGGLRIPVHGFVAVGNFMQALTSAAMRHGARFQQAGRVTRIVRSGTDIAVETDQGDVDAGAIVLAAGSWSGQVEVEDAIDRLPVRPVRGQLLHLGWRGAPLKRVIWGERCYLVPWDDGTLLVGATVEDAGFDERNTVAGVRDLIEAACELVPHAWTASVLSTRAGLRPASGDALPIIGASSVLPKLMYATGHYRNGVLLSPLTAQLVADVILAGKTDPLLELTRPDRFGSL